MGQATIDALKTIAPIYKDKLTIMMDSGIRDGADIARVLACDTDFTFLGRSFMYGVAALGNKGGNHTISLLKTQLHQIMEQFSCNTVKDFPKLLI